MPNKSPIWLAVEKLTERLDALELRLTPPANVPSVSSVEKPIDVPQDSFPKYPIPPDFVDIVDLVFNKNFGIRCEPLKDSPAFLFTIVVPSKYSKVNGEDLRPKVISNADGSSGVRLWAEKVFNNFDGDTQALIVLDRPFANRPI